MKKVTSIKIEEELLNKVKEYCKMNKIKIYEFFEALIRQKLELENKAE